MTTLDERKELVGQMNTPGLAARVQELLGLWKAARVAIIPDQTLVEVSDSRLKRREIELFADGIEGKNAEERAAFVQRGKAEDEEYYKLVVESGEAKTQLATSKATVETTWEDYRAIVARSAQVTAVINFFGGPN